MATKTINLEDFSQFLGKFSAEHIEFIEDSVAKGVARSIPELVRQSPVDTGQYASSWNMKREKHAVTVGNFAPHAPIIEYGSRPFKPPIKPLLDWAKRVLQDSSQPPSYSPEVWRLAVGTQKKIEKYGQLPKHILQKSIPMIVGYIDEELKRGV